MAIRFLDTILSGSLSISGSYTLPPIDTGSTGVLGQIGMSAEVPYFYSSQGWQIVSGSEAYSTPPSATIEYLVIAGGGGGSSGIGNGNGTGGGGAGGMLSSSLADIESGTKFTVTVGAGGNGGTPSTMAGRSSAQRGTDGGDSSLASAAGTSFTTVTAVGGGSGGRYYGDTAGNDGGSGGGGASYSGAGGSGTTGQGNDGGVATPSGNSTYRGGGGGGKSEAGATGAASGNGGAGTASKITGNTVNYAGGGGGGTYTAAGGSGGTGGGGAGSNQANTAGSGTTNTGGGGGGGGWPGSSSSTGGQGGAGGSGVVVLGFPTASLSASGSQQRAFFGNRVAHIINSTSTFTLSSPVTHTHGTLDVFGDSSCVALYQLDGNANDRGGNYNGTASNVTYSQGYINNGGVFNGSSGYIDLPAGLAPVLRSAASFGVSLWFKRNGNQPNTTYGGKLFQLLNDIYVNINLQGNNTVRANIVTSTPAYPETVTGVVPDNAWNHIVFTGDNNGIKLYLNGSLADSDNWDGTFMTYTNANYKFNRIGYQGSGISYFEGEIDQVRIFSKALSASEVLTLYNE